MASSSGWRLHVQCIGCDAGAWIGPAPHGRDAWCECCQRGARIEGGEDDPAPACAHCGTPLTTGAPRFVEIGGQLQHLDAVLAAGEGDPAPLRALLPERPRFLADLDPPAGLPGDSPVVAGALDALAEGRFRDALAVLEQPGQETPRAACPERARDRPHPQRRSGARRVRVERAARPR